MSAPVRLPKPTLISWWCETCGSQHMPSSGPMPSRHYSIGPLPCPGAWLQLTYQLVTPVTEEEA